VTYQPPHSHHYSITRPQSTIFIKIVDSDFIDAFKCFLAATSSSSNEKPLTSGHNPSRYEVPFLPQNPATEGREVLEDFYSASAIDRSTGRLRISRLLQQFSHILGSVVS
jgi:hypothetical protein